MITGMSKSKQLCSSLETGTLSAGAPFSKFLVLTKGGLELWLTGKLRLKILGDCGGGCVTLLFLGDRDFGDTGMVSEVGDNSVGFEFTGSRYG